MQSHLLDLAKETSSEKRRELLHEVSDLFVVGAEHHQDREILLFGDVLSRLLDFVEIEDRAQLSRNVAELAATPRQLALRLANDEAEVATPVLIHSKALTESDLGDLARTHGDSHLEAISQRDFLSEALTDIIVERGGNRVLATLASNDGAQFSEKGITTLSIKAENDKNIGNALSHRTDLPEEVVSHLVKILDPVARERLKNIALRDKDALSGLLDKAAQTIESNRLERKKERFEAKVMLSDILSGQLSLDSALSILMSASRLSDLVFILSSVSQVPEAHVSNVLFKVKADGIAILCKAIGVSEDCYRELSLMRCKRLRISERQADLMAANYKNTDKAQAERALRFYKVRTKQ